jgi:hypothetical protein
VQEVYRILVHRPATQAEANALSAYLAATGDRVGVANYVARLPEAREVLVVGWFERFLGRLPVNGEEGPFVAALLAGHTEEQVLASLLATDLLPAASDTVFVQVLFARVVGRAPTFGEDLESLYATIPQAGRGGLAYILLTSPEYRTDVVVGDFLTILNRGEAPPPFLHFAGLLQPRPLGAAEVLAYVNSGLDLTGLTVAFLSRPDLDQSLC